MLVNMSYSSFIKRNSVVFIRITLISIIGLVASCTPSPILFKEHALYNFSEEGFLSGDLVQTIGTSPYPGDLVGKEGVRRMCLQLARDNARNRMLTIFLHTYFDIPPTNNQKSIENTFQEDFPMTFNSTDLIRAEVDFQELLKDAYVALQDSRNPKKCSVVYRIMKANLPDSIRDTKTTFVPEVLRRDGRYTEYMDFHPE